MTARYIDLFAGIGGFRLGCENLGFEVCVLTSELDENAVEVYSQNFSEDRNRIVRDVRSLADRPIQSVPDHELLMAGFPCQPFSHAGRRGGFEDTRGTLFFSLATIIRAKMPNVVLLENVRGLLSHDGGHTFDVIRNTLVELRYRVFAQVLNARDFGLPQNRNRVFIVGIREDLPESDLYVFPQPTHDRKLLRVSQVLEEAPDSNLTISDKLWDGHRLRRERNRSRGLGFGYQIFSPDDPYTATLSARYFKDGSEILIAQESSNPRKISVREAGNLQGFPTDFRFSKSQMHAYKQLGNAVPVPVVSALIRSLEKFLR